MKSLEAGLIQVLGFCSLILCCSFITGFSIQRACGASWVYSTFGIYSIAHQLSTFKNSQGLYEHRYCLLRIPQIHVPDCHGNYICKLGRYLYCHRAHKNYAMRQPVARGQIHNSRKGLNKQGESVGEGLFGSDDDSQPLPAPGNPMLIISIWVVVEKGRIWWSRGLFFSLPLLWMARGDAPSSVVAAQCYSVWFCSWVPSGLHYS